MYFSSSWVDSAESAPRVQINSSSLGMLNLRVIFKSRTLNLTINHVFMVLHDPHCYPEYQLAGPILRCVGPPEPLSLVVFWWEGNAHQTKKHSHVAIKLFIYLPSQRLLPALLSSSVLPCYLPVCSKGGAWLMVMGRILKPVKHGHERFFWECNILQRLAHDVVRFLIFLRLPGLIFLQLICFWEMFTLG